MSKLAAKPRRATFRLIAIVLGAVAGLAIFEVGLRYHAAYVRSQEQMDSGFLVFDPQLGWRMAPGWKGRHRHYDFDVTYSINDRGLRGPWPAKAQEASSGRVRHAFVGDSFTFGLGVNDEETFAHRLSEVDSSTVYLNAGIAGFSTDQQYLYLKEHLPGWQLDRMSLVVYLANDLLDNTLTYPLQADMGKPAFRLESADLRLTNVPVPLQPKPAAERRRTLAVLVMGEEAAETIEGSWRNQWQLARRIGLAESSDNDGLAEMPQRLAYSMDLFVRLVQEMSRLCEENNVSMNVILMPGRSYVELPGSLSARFQEFLREEILKRKSDVKVPVLDVASRLRKEQERKKDHLFHPNEGHLTPAGHQTVASVLRELTKP